MKIVQRIISMFVNVGKYFVTRRVREDWFNFFTGTLGLDIKAITESAEFPEFPVSQT